jgi:tetratricopeptide (TPR) repeat protein
MTFKAWFPPTASAVVLILACGASLGFRTRADRTPRRLSSAPGPAAVNDRTPYEPGLVDRTIAFWEQQTTRDPEGFLELRELAAAYLARQREAGDIADAVRAEDAARRSLKIRRQGNTAAMIRLGRALLAQHRFPEALEVAQFAATTDPEAARLVADVQIELGDYDAARKTLAASPPVGDDPNFLVLQARLDEVDGHVDSALRLLREALRLVDARPDIPAEAVAWYRNMIGHALIDAGRLDEGEQACLGALAVFPRDYRAMTGLAEVASWRGDWPKAIEWGEKALAVAPQNPAARKLVGDAQAAQGNSEQADRHYQLLTELFRSFPRIYDRQRAQFSAETGRDLDQALALARADLELRKDVQGYDTLAWVCLKKGMQAEAEAAIAQALAKGTRRATFFYHAGMIARSGKDPARARECFAQARAINPRSVPIRWVRWLEAQADPAPSGEPGANSRE